MGEPLNQYTKRRNSNLELFRIITMLLIVAHHYVVNSGLLAQDGPVWANPLSSDSLFLLIVGAWGKIGINCFVLITGYFMCKSDITARKFMKLFCEIMFYRIIIGVTFIVTGYQPFEWGAFFKLFVPVLAVKQNFSGCFILFFLFIPFLNILIRNLDERRHIYLLVLCAVTYVLFGTIHLVDMNYVSWFMVLYLVASYIRLFPKKWMDSLRFSGALFLLSVLAAILSVCFGAWLSAKTGMNLAFYFVSDSNTFLALMTGVSSFLFFKNLKMNYSAFINAVASTTFGVLLIHANCATMRQWLWHDLLDNVGHYGMPLYVLGCVLGIFALCSAIDYLRIRFIELPFFKYWDAKEEEMMARFKTSENCK